MSLQAGSAFLDIIPKLASGFGDKLSSDVDPEAEKSGESAGKKFSLKLAAGMAAAGALFAKTFSDSLDIDAGTDKVAASLNLTGDIAAVAGKAASTVYKGAWGDSMDDVQDAVGAVGSSLLKLNKDSQPELERLTEHALDLATAFEIDVNRATSSAGILMKTGMAKDANEAFDLITAGLQHVPAQVREDILDATDEYSTYFHGLGFTGSQAIKLLTDASAGGMIQIDKTGDAIKEFSIRATDMSTTSVAAYKAIGLDAKTMSDNVLAGGDKARGAFDKIVDGLLKIKDPTVQANTVIGLFGTQAEDIGVKNIPSFLQGLHNSAQGMGDVQGATDRMSATLNGNAKTTLESFKRQAMMGLTDFIGGTAIPKFTELSDVVSDKLGKNVGLVKDAIVIASAVMASAVALHAATIVGGWVAMGAASVWNGAVMVASFIATSAAATASGIETAAIAALYVGDWVLMASSAIYNSAVIVGGWIATGISAVGAGVVMAVQVALQVGGWILLGATALAQAALVAAAWLISMGPIVLVVAAVVALVALIVVNWDTILRVTKEAWNATWDTVKAVGEGIKTAAKAMLDAMVFMFLNFTGPGLLINHFGSIKKAGGEAFQWVIDRATDFWNWINGIPGKLAGINWSNAWHGLQDAFRSALNWVIDKWNNFRIPAVEVLGKQVSPEINFPDIGRFAKGGVTASTFIAGENGAELVTTASSARVLSHSDTMKAIEGSGGTTIEKHYHYHNESKNKDPLAEEFRQMERLALPI